MVEKIVIFLHLFPQIPRELPGVDGGADPQDTQIPVHRRGRNKAVGSSRHRIPLPAFHGAQLRPGPFTHLLGGGRRIIKEQKIGIPVCQLLKINAGRSVHLRIRRNSHVFHHIGPHLVKICTRSNAAQPIGTVENDGFFLFHGFKHSVGLFENPLDIQSQLFGLFLHAQQLAQHPVGLRRIRQPSFNKYTGNPQQFLQVIQILANGVLGFAEINDDVRSQGGHFLHIQFAPGFVQVPGFRQIAAAVAQVLLLLRGDCRRDRHQLVTGQRPQKHLGHIAGGNNPGNLSGYLHLPAGGISENAGLCFCGIAAVRKRSPLFFLRRRRRTTRGNQQHPHRQAKGHKPG